MLAFIPAAVFAIGWVIFGQVGGFSGLCGILAAILAAGTVYCTAMIYRSLKPIRQWHNPHTAADYMIYAVFSGAVLLAALWSLWFGTAQGLAVAALIAALAAGVAKFAYWRFIDATSARSTVESATGLGRRGRVRLLEPPHTEENYLLQEMGFRIARKHARRLRGIARATAFVVPLALSLFALFTSGGWGTLATGIAVASAALGLVVERWLFFAEAKHTVMLYYGADAV